jgi:hypothetical protein
MRAVFRDQVVSLDSDALELVTGLWIIWCRGNNRNPDELLSNCGVILKRFRNGESSSEDLVRDLRIE